MDADVARAARALRERGAGTPQLGVVLGSGLGRYGEGAPLEVPYSSIEGFPRPTVPGHDGLVRCGRRQGKDVMFFSGRFHPYEGLPARSYTFLPRLLKALGASTYLVTCAAGGIRPDFRPGDLMLIEDHLNFGPNPLWGPNDDEIGPRFFDMTHAYDEEYLDKASAAADKLGIFLHRGVYAYMRGPSFETPAEIRALRALGADAVGMSTVQEVIAARHAGLRVLGIACISNMAAGLSAEPLGHGGVLETGLRVGDRFSRLLDAVIEAL